MQALAVLLAPLLVACQDGLNVGALRDAPPINVDPTDSRAADGASGGDAAPDQRPGPTDGPTTAMDAPSGDTPEAAANDADSGTGGDVAGDGAQALQWKPAQVNFGPVAVGTSSPVQAIHLANAGRVGLRQLSVVTSGGEFELVIMPVVAGEPQCHGMTELAAGAGCVAFVRFNPQVRLPEKRTASATLTAGGVFATVAMSATVVAPDRIVLQRSEPILLDAAVFPAPERIRLMNEGGSPTGTLVVRAHGVTLVSHDCVAPLPAKGECRVSVDYFGLKPGSGLLVVTSSLGGYAELVLPPPFMVVRPGNIAVPAVPNSAPQ